MTPDECRPNAYGRKGGAGEQGGAEAAEKGPLQGAELASHKYAPRRWSDQYTGRRRAAETGEDSPRKRHAEALPDHARGRQQA
jgi:hypothetical protein